MKNIKNIKVFNHDEYRNVMCKIENVARWYIENKSDYEGLDDYMSFYFISGKHRKLLTSEIEKLEVIK